MKFSNQVFDTEAALIEQEKAVLSSLETEYGLADLEPDETEPNLLSSIKGCLKKYEEIRSTGICKPDLLEKIHRRLCLYRLLEPGFYSGPLLCMEHLRNAVAALRERKKPGRNDGERAGDPKPVWKIYGGLF